MLSDRLHLASKLDIDGGAQKSALPKSATGKAAHYTLALWPRLICFLNHPALELSNNLAENSMRPIAVGRIHIGIAQAGPKIAAILSVIERTQSKLPIEIVAGDWQTSSHVCTQP